MESQNKTDISLITKIFLICSILFFSNAIEGQNPYRRHFIITYDASIGFNHTGVGNILEQIFQGDKRVESCESSILRKENLDGKLFFDTLKDEISFYNFNLSTIDFASLKGQTNGTQLTQEITRLFLKEQPNWTTYKKQIPDIKSYIIARLRGIVVSTDYSIPNFVFPLVLSRIDQTNPAEEYVLIILTKNPPESFNVADQHTLASHINSSVDGLFEKQLAALTAQFTKTNYFSCTGIYSYLITPKNILPASAATAVKINSDIEFSQDNYNGNDFIISPIRLQFPENNSLIPVEVKLTISLADKDSNNLIYKDIIASDNGDGKLRSNYSNSGIDLIGSFRNFINHTGSTFNIPSLKLYLPELNSDRSPDSLRLNFEIKSKAKTLGDHSLNFVFYANTLVSDVNINYIGAARHLFYIIVPIIIILLIVIFLVVYGKPINIRFTVNGYLDSFEKIDYKKHGKLTTPYKFWNGQNDSLVVDGEITYKNLKYPFNWRPAIYLTIKDNSVPIGFEVFLKPNFGSDKEFHKGYNMAIKPTKENDINFVICLRQNDINIKVKKPQFVKISVDCLVREFRFLFIKSELRESVSYNYHIGSDLGDVWIGLDPGTTGSCISVGSQGDNIIFGEDRSKLIVIDSKLIFETSENYFPTNGEIPESLYKLGTIARTRFGTPGVASFQSIKKLLGYKDIKKITFKNQTTLELTGKDLSGLLVKGLFKELRNFVSTIDNREYFSKGVFNPKRAVIAIPNNFTISKIQDIIDCTNQLNQFEEIRYVYEAEAVLFYYLSNYNRFNKGKYSFKDENILVFDMGGATINATVISATKVDEVQKSVYYVDILGKIGYGVGGDTIDYCLIKFIKEFANEYPEFKNLKFNADNKESLVKAARAIKLQIGDYFEKDFDTLITTTQLERILNETLSEPIQILEESKFYQSFKKNSKGNYKLFSHPILVELIYNNVKDAINEVIELSGNCKIDKVIFSGRSTFFPIIKETVEKQLKGKGIVAEIVILDIEESKTAVAYGACWYGINKNSIRLNNLKTNASFGIKHTIGPAMTNAQYIELINMGCSFDSTHEGISRVENQMAIDYDFALDGEKVNFYQVMGKDASTILSLNQKHKYSKIASIRLPMKLMALQMVVSENDEIDCKVKLKSNEILAEKGVVSDQEIMDANEEHYTWIIN